jgi:hypothetical protein
MLNVQCDLAMWLLHLCAARFFNIHTVQSRFHVISKNEFSKNFYAWLNSKNSKKTLNLQKPSSWSYTQTRMETHNKIEGT